MRFALLSCLLLSVSLTGCTQLGSLLDSASEEPCIPISTAQAAYQAADGFFVDLASKTVTLRLEGTVEGEVGSYLIAIDQGSKAFWFQGPEGDFRMVGPEFSVESEGEAFWGRNHDPAHGMKATLEDIFSEDFDVQFEDDLVFEDFVVGCKILGSQEVIEFTYEYEDTLESFLTETEPPYRLLSGRSVDPLLQDAFRVSVSYDRPTIQVDGSATKVPATLEFELISQEDLGDGYSTRIKFGPGSEWIPLEDLDLAIVGAEDFDMGQLYNLYDIEPGSWDIDEGYFEFLDRDGNQLISEGDIIEVGLVYGYDFNFFDAWADEYAYWEYT